MDLVLQASLNFLDKIEKLDIPLVDLDIKLIKPKYPVPTLDHHNYPIDKPIFVMKIDNYYSIIDGHHRYKQALDLGKPTILSKIYVKT